MSFVRNQPDFSRHVNVTKKRCLCLRSNMTKRGKGLRKPQCSVCGSRSHRIETCSHPLAEKMRCLIAEKRKLKGAKKQKSAEGKQNRPRKNKQFGKHVSTMCESSNGSCHIPTHPPTPHPGKHVVSTMCESANGRCHIPTHPPTQPTPQHALRTLENM